MSSQTKYIFVTGGVSSSLGKGIIASPSTLEVRGKMIGVSLIKELVKVAKRKGCYKEKFC